MIGTPLRVTRLTKELAQSYVRWPPCLAASCWLSAVDPHAPACKEYLVKGLSAKLLGLWKARYGRALTVLRLEHMLDHLGRAAATLAAMLGLPRPSAAWQRPELTRTPRRLRWVRTGYAYQPPALGTYRRRRAACPQGAAYCTYWVRVPATGVPYVPRTVAPQAW